MNEHFRQLEEISDPAEHFPPQIKLHLLQNAVRPIDDLRIVENFDEFQSVTTGYGRSSSLKYQSYYDLLINACIRYDRTKKANIAKRGHIYQTSSTPDNDEFNDEIPYETLVRDPYMGIDTSSDEVLSFKISIKLNMFHQCQLGTNFSLDFPSQIKVQKHFQRHKSIKDGLVLFIYQHIYTNF